MPGFQTIIMHSNADSNESYRPLARKRAFTRYENSCFCATSSIYPFVCCAQDVEYADVLVVGLELDGVKRTLDLRLNSDLIPIGYQQRHQHRGTYKVYTPSKVVSKSYF